MKILYSIIIILFFNTSLIFSHPHVFIDLSIAFKIDETNILGFWEEWKILRSFGENIGPAYDNDNDGKFDNEETKLIKKEVFDNIIKYNYYTFINTDEGVFFPSEITDFSVKINEKSTIFKFFVPCKIIATNDNQTFELTIRDFSHYVSFGLVNIDDPYSNTIDYNLYIERDGDYYSHSCDFGNAVIIINIKSKKVLQNSSNEHRSQSLQGLAKLAEEDGLIKNTISNPFLLTEKRIKDGNENPFFSY